MRGNADNDRPHRKRDSSFAACGGHPAATAIRPSSESMRDEYG